MGQNIEQKIEENFRDSFDRAAKFYDTESGFENYCKTKAKEKGLDFTKDDVNTCFNKILGYYLKDFRLYKEKERLKKDKEDLQEKKNEEIKKLLEANEEKNKEMEQFQEQKNNEIKELLKENKKTQKNFKKKC